MWDSRIAAGMIQGGAEDSRHAVSSKIARGLFDEIIDAACDAWRNLEADPERITSIGMRMLAHVDQRPSLLVLFVWLVRSSGRATTKSFAELVTAR